jgi:hypothetical protein
MSAAIALTRQHAQHGEVGVRFHGKGNVLVRHASKALGKDPGMAFQRGARIDIDRRTHRLGNSGQSYVFGVEDAVLQFKMIHEMS